MASELFFSTEATIFFSVLESFWADNERDSNTAIAANTYFEVMLVDFTTQGINLCG
jgi:hypothetical protein